MQFTYKTYLFTAITLIPENLHEQPPNDDIVAT